MTVFEFGWLCIYICKNVQSLKIFRYLETESNFSFLIVTTQFSSNFVIELQHKFRSDNGTLRFYISSEISKGL